MIEPPEMASNAPRADLDAIVSDAWARRPGEYIQFISLWSTYYVQEGALKGFGVGGGVYGFTSRNASIFGPGQVEIPGYVRIDAALYYNHELRPGNWLGAKYMNIALNLRNLLDKGFIESAQNSTTAFFFGEPRTVLATVGLQF